MRYCEGSCSLKAGSVATGTPRQQPGVRRYSGAEPDAQVAEEDQVRKSSLPHLASRHPGATRSWWVDCRTRQTIRSDKGVQHHQSTVKVLTGGVQLVAKSSVS